MGHPITCDVVVMVSNHFLRGWLHFLHKTLIVGQHETITTATELCGVHCNMCLITSWEGPKPHPLPGRVLNHTHLPHSNLTTVHILHQDMGYQTFVFWHIVLLHTHLNLASFPGLLFGPGNEANVPYTSYTRLCHTKSSTYCLVTCPP